MTVPHPSIVSRQDWLRQRKALLAEEKALTKVCDRVNAERRPPAHGETREDLCLRRLAGKMGLADLFAGRRQLIVYHFMFDPAWEKGCPGCTRYVNALGDLSPVG